MDAVPYTVILAPDTIVLTCPAHVVTARNGGGSVAQVTVEDGNLRSERFDCAADELPDLAQALCDGELTLT